jgi:ribosomal protein S15P/S13E
MLTLFLFQRELNQLKNEYQSSADKVIKTQIQKDIALLTAAIKEMKEALEARCSFTAENI